MTKPISQLTVDTIRTLCIDIIEKSKSGHPGMPLGSAPMAYTLWSDFLKFSPNHSEWLNRDRFVLAAGHGSSMLYTLLHLYGYPEMTLTELKNFRQLGSKTPGHPEFGHTKGVDATSGPLGQGIASAVGVAIAEAHMGATYNKPNFKLIDHYTYAICGDGDLMEGVSGEASSLAGHLKLDKLIVLYDSNDISLDGELNKSFSENVSQRYKSYGWQVIHVENGNGLLEINEALKKAKSDTERPTLIEVKTTIGFGSPNKQGTSSSHGSPLGAEESILTKESYGWPIEESFFIPDEVKKHTLKIGAKGDQEYNKWLSLLNDYKEEYPADYERLEKAVNFDYEPSLLNFSPIAEDTNEATRVSSSKLLNDIASQVPSLVGGSADLFCSNLTYQKNGGDFMPGKYGNKNIWFGVREFAMGAIANGMYLHGGVRPYISTFLVFSDYLKPAIRMAALMKLPVIYIFSHDSIAVGEDGPTHEPIEQLAGLRSMPNVNVIRPADAKEMQAAWQVALESKETPTALIVTRQNLAVLKNSQEYITTGVSKGAYIVSDSEAEGLLLASGSEVNLAIEAQQELAKQGIQVKVVSMPSWELFEKQSKDYQESILPKHLTKRVSIEMGTRFGWSEYVGTTGISLSIERYGESAPADELLSLFGFTVDKVTEAYHSL
ncbi:transketolase [Vagococcus intermedius]|uniref:Transketolase n=1 Tax=Vagococcus intermedius TaxID=2991418 RepID=A0AAF0CUC5_9ENTE|nr:transketolase [Vagococcus intermedius]WEG73073.1 transketolase [Vagococcus intermedius]WEG75157.1 transketolase [Vagococcus intermedius]